MSEVVPPSIEVVFALPRRQVTRKVALTPGATVRDVIATSGILDDYPALAEAAVTWGIWGRVADLDTVLEGGERIEAYRPLLADPKEARRRRVRR
jgi:putative ubiquitin-RnfH superfamily antitoxin RatB of RatAB toxin-antitoxin module